jgi:S-formylglutathione hydrolase FrmB
MGRARATVALAVCLLAAGCGGRARPASSLLEHANLESGALGRWMEFSVLRAPPGGEVDHARLPVFVLLHGMGEDNRSLDRHGVAAALHEAMAAGDAPRAHFVLPAGERGFFINWHDGSARWEDHVLEEVLPAAERMLGVAPFRERRHVIGVSMGGFAALRIGLRRPDLFSSATCLSSFVYDQDQARDFFGSPIFNLFVDMERVFGDGSDKEFVDAHDVYLMTERRAPDIGQRLFFAAGNEEYSGFRETGEQFHAHLDRLGVEHEWVVYDGGHKWYDWLPVIERAMRYVTAGD